VKSAEKAHISGLRDEPARYRDQRISDVERANRRSLFVRHDIDLIAGQP
jgi:hypothetical protein